ncbi:MAG: hypothetical protein AAGB04_00760 [Pseudomonadota bacterium]
MSRKSAINSRRRQEQILTALTVSQLDARQLQRLSLSFDDPFSDELYARRAMNRLLKRGLVIEHSFPDRRKYWRLSREGYRLVYGPDKAIPTKPSIYRAISASYERHARKLADLLVEIRVAAFLAGIEVVFIYGDHQRKLTHDGETKIPDAVVGLKLKGRKTYTIIFELDCGTEPVPDIAS